MNTRIKNTIEKIISKVSSMSINKKHINKSKNISWSIIRAVFLFGFAFIILYPLLNMISLAFMDKKDLFDNAVLWIPKNFTIDNIRNAGKMIEYPVALRNSLILCTLTTLAQTLSCLMVGYGFARFEFPFKKILFSMVILTIMVPPQLIMIPLYLHFRLFDVFGIIKLLTANDGVNLLDSIVPSILLSATANGIRNGLFIYIFRQFFRGMPIETEEAARVDGAGPVRTFYQIMVPAALTAIVTVALFSFVWQWNDTIYSGLFFQRTQILAITYNKLGLLTPEMIAQRGSFFSQQDLLNPYILGMLKSTGVFIIMLPLVVIYMFAQKFFVESIERSGIVG